MKDIMNVDLESGETDTFSHLESEYENDINIENAVNYDEDTPSPLIGVKRDRADTGASLVGNEPGSSASHCKRLFSNDEPENEKSMDVISSSPKTAPSLCVSQSPPMHLRTLVRGQLKGSKSMGDLTVVSNIVSDTDTNAKKPSDTANPKYDKIELLFAQSAKIATLADKENKKNLKTPKDIRTEQLLSQAIQFHAENQDPTTSGYFTTEIAAAITRSASKYRTNARTPYSSTAKAPATETDFTCDFVGYKLNEVEAEPVISWFSRKPVDSTNGIKNSSNFYVDYIVHLKIRDSSYMEHTVQCITHRPFSNCVNTGASSSFSPPGTPLQDSGNDGMVYNTLLDITIFRRYSEFHQLHTDIISELKVAMINYGYNGNAVNCQPIIDRFRSLFPEKKSFYSYTANLPHLYQSSTHTDKISTNESFHLQRKFDLHHWFMHVIETISGQYRAHRFNGLQHLRQHKLKPLPIQISHNTLDSIMKIILRFLTK